MAHTQTAPFADRRHAGCDVAHPSPGVTSRPSVASLVASVDEFATRYHTEVRVQPPRQEAIDGIGEMVKVSVDCTMLSRMTTRLLRTDGHPALPEASEEVPWTHRHLSRWRLGRRVHAGRS